MPVTVRVKIDSAQDVGNDVVVIVGTVNGDVFQIEVWKSHLTSLANRAQRVAYCKQELAQRYLSAHRDLVAAPVDVTSAETDVSVG